MVLPVISQCIYMLQQLKSSDKLKDHIVCYHEAVCVFTFDVLGIRPKHWQMIMIDVLQPHLCTC